MFFTNSTLDTGNTCLFMLDMDRLSVRSPIEKTQATIFFDRYCFLLRTNVLEERLPLIPIRSLCKRELA